MAVELQAVLSPPTAQSVCDGSWVARLRHFSSEMKDKSLKRRFWDTFGVFDEPFSIPQPDTTQSAPSNGSSEGSEVIGLMSGLWGSGFAN